MFCVSRGVGGEGGGEGGGSLQGGEHERDLVSRPVTPVAVVRAWLSPPGYTELAELSLRTTDILDR